MGSKLSDECRIDGLAQAWAVMSKAAPPERARQAMDAVQRELVSESGGFIRLLTPAFQNTANDPGYIKGYVPGVRENGGQYTHAALWVVRAFAELGRHDLAAHLLAMLSPVHHTSDPGRLAIYRAEPYVVVADIYGEPPHVGRGGWTWYTGSAGWMLRVAVESVLGIRLVRGEGLRIQPCTPGEWREYRVAYRTPGSEALYAITVRCPDGRPGPVTAAVMDGQPLAVQQGAVWVPFAAAGGRHELEIVVGGGAPS
jgi:cyclic beta-1,2-glucan synthetase